MHAANIPASPLLASLVEGLRANRTVDVTIAGTDVDGEHYEISFFITSIKVAKKYTKIAGHIYGQCSGQIDSQGPDWDCATRAFEFKTETASKDNAWTLTRALAGSKRRSTVDVSRPCLCEDADLVMILRRAGWWGGVSDDELRAAGHI